VKLCHRITRSICGVYQRRTRAIIIVKCENISKKNKD
jgi:regulator of extracellular matrix RemA (YlzA/DUF370 family)